MSLTGQGVHNVALLLGTLGEGRIHFLAFSQSLAIACIPVLLASPSISDAYDLRFFLAVVSLVLVCIPLLLLMTLVITLGPSE